MSDPITGFRTLQSLTAKETFKGYVDIATRPLAKGTQTFNIGELNWRDRCLYYDAVFENHGLAKSIATTIAGQLMAEGTYITENDRIHTEQSCIATEAKLEIEQLNEDIHLDQLLYDATLKMVKHGSVFFETDESEWNIRLIPFQETVEPYKQDSQGEITDWRQIIQNQQAAEWNIEQNEIIHTSWGISGKSWPYGTSLYAGLDVDFETLQQLKLDLKEYMHNNAFPMEIYAVGDGQYMPTGDDLAQIRSFVKVMQPGQKMITSYPINHVSGGVGDREVRGIQDILPFIKEEIIDGGGIPPVSKQWNATEASAKEMMPWTMANYITPLQRIFRFDLEEHFYKPYLEELGYSMRLCPKLLFAPPDANKVEDAQFWTGLISAGLPAAYAWEELGFDVDHIQELQDENDKRMLEQQKLQAALNPEGSVPKDAKPKQEESAKEFDEWMVRKRKAL